MDLSEVQSRFLSRRSEGDHNNPHSGWLTSRLYFEPSTSRVHVYSVTTRPVYSVGSLIIGKMSVSSVKPITFVRLLVCSLQIHINCAPGQKQSIRVAKSVWAQKQHPFSAPSILNSGGHDGIQQIWSGVPGSAVWPQRELGVAWFGSSVPHHGRLTHGWFCVRSKKTASLQPGISHVPSLLLAGEDYITTLSVNIIYSVEWYTLSTTGTRVRHRQLVT
jgi:hypothetical protein